MKMRFKKHLRSYKTNADQVKCTCCGHCHYQWWMITQGIGCASYIHFNQEKQIYQVYSCYGSVYDTSLFNVVDNRIIYTKYIKAIEQQNTLTNPKDKQEYRKNLLICDKCIEGYIAKEYITEDINYNSFAVVEELSSFWQEDPILYMDLLKDKNPEEVIKSIREERAKSSEQRMTEKDVREASLDKEYVRKMKENPFEDEI